MLNWTSRLPICTCIQTIEDRIMFVVTSGRNNIPWALVITDRTLNRELSDFTAMSRQCRFKVSGDPVEKLEFLRRTATGKGITFNGDQNKGSFWGHGLLCNYFRIGDEVIVNIESVPPGSSFDDIAKMIETFLCE